MLSIDAFENGSGGVSCDSECPFCALSHGPTSLSDLESDNGQCTSESVQRPHLDSG
jgi:lipoate synthase